MTISLSDLKAKRAAMIDPLPCDARGWPANATGIVATHNAADCLIEFADAALALEKIKVASDSNLSRWNGKLDAAELRYRAALAKIKP